MSEPETTHAPDSGTMPEQDLVTRFLAGRQVSCPACNYALTDLPGGVCPECGLALQIELARPAPNRRAFNLAVIGLSTGLGYSGIYLVLVWIAVFDVGYPNNLKWYLPLYASVLVQALALVLLTRSWASVGRASPRAQWAIAFAGWGLTAAFMTWFYFWIF